MSKRDCRVCMVAPLYHPSQGGVGKQAKLLTERLAAEGVTVMVITRRMKGLPPAIFPPEVRVFRAWSLKPYLHTFEDVTLANILVSLSFCLSCALLLVHNRREYTIVHFHGASLPLVICLPLLKLMRKRVVAKVAGTLGTEAGALRDRYCGLGNLLIRLLRRVDRFIATSSEIATGLLHDGFSQETIVRIPNFIQTESYPPVASDLKTQKKKAAGLRSGPIVTYSGRFITSKGLAYLLGAWQVLASRQPTASLLLLGDGPLLADMRRLAAELKILDRVDFRGHLADVREYLQATDIFVLPSLQEGMPNSLLEAMAAALPVVATNIGGVRDVLDHGQNGWLVAPRDAAALAAGLETLLGDVRLARKLAANGFRTILDRYSLDGVVLKYIELYQKIEH
jgi:glycosyltransferase involved in cell wall biosynthesis